MLTPVDCAYENCLIIYLLRATCLANSRSRFWTHVVPKPTPPPTYLLNTTRLVKTSPVWVAIRNR